MTSRNITQPSGRPATRVSHARCQVTVIHWNFQAKLNVYRCILCFVVKSFELYQIFHCQIDYFFLRWCTSSLFTGLDKYYIWTNYSYWRWPVIDIIIQHYIQLTALCALILVHTICTFACTHAYPPPHAYDNLSLSWRIECTLDWLIDWLILH